MCFAIVSLCTLGAGGKTLLHTPKAVTYHEQYHTVYIMIGHSLGRIESSAVLMLTTLFFVHDSQAMKGLNDFQKPIVGAAIDALTQGEALSEIIHTIWERNGQAGDFLTERGTSQVCCFTVAWVASCMHAAVAARTSYKVGRIAGTSPAWSSVRSSQHPRVC